MKWFEKHLNWTLIAVLAVTTAVAVVALWEAWRPFGDWRWMSLVACVVPLIPGAWVIRRKSQSPRWLAVVCAVSGGCAYMGAQILGYYSYRTYLPLFPGVVGAVPLALANRSAVAGPEVGRSLPSSSAARSDEGLTACLGGMALGLVLLAGAIGIILYMLNHEFNTGLTAGAAILGLSAVLLFLPEQSYWSRTPCCFLARLLAAPLIISGLAGVFVGGFAVAFENHDPGHGIGTIGGLVLAGAVLLFLSARVLVQKARKGLEKSGQW